MGRRQKPQHEKLNTVINTKIDSGLMQRFMRVCRADNRTQAFIAREAIREYVEHREAKGQAA